MSLKILLADDNMTAQNTGRKILMEAGYTVVAVSNGSAALKKFAAEKPDLLVLDVFMPGYSGLEVCQKLKTEAKVPVLLTYSKMEPFRSEDGDRVRADGSVPKPFNASELLDAVSKLASAIAPKQPEQPAAESAQDQDEPQPVHNEVQEGTDFARPHEVEQAAHSGASLTFEPGAAKSTFELALPEVSLGRVEEQPSVSAERTEAELSFAAAARSAGHEERDSEAGFFAFGSRSTFAASALDRESAEAGHNEIAGVPAGREVFAEVGLSAPEEPANAAPAVALTAEPPVALQAAEPAAPSASTASWWTAQPMSDSDLAGDGPAVAMQPATEFGATADGPSAALERASGSDLTGDGPSLSLQSANELDASARPGFALRAVSEADPNHEPGFASQTMSNAAESLSAPTADLARPDTFGAESDEPAGFHSVLAQLMPPAPVEIPQFGGELNGSAALIADHQEAFEMPQPETLPAQREAAELPVASGEPQADSQSQSEATLAPALSIEEAASLLNPDTRDENVPATIEELPVAGASQLEAQTVNSQESEPQPVAPAQNGHEPRAEEVAEAIERVLARFKESLISEVMREFSTK